jgi:predicted translin family RNA/ssDNA-binding protein
VSGFSKDGIARFGCQELRFAAKLDSSEMIRRTERSQKASFLMQSENQPEPKQNPDLTPAVEHVSRAHEALNALRKRIGEHPELAEAITKLESALNILTVKTGGML